MVICVGSISLLSICLFLPLPRVYKATVKQLAETKTIRVSSYAGIEDAVIQRIKKCLQCANHPTTPEAEDEAALHLALRLLGQNLSGGHALSRLPPSPGTTVICSLHEDV